MQFFTPCSPQIFFTPRPSSKLLKALRSDDNTVMREILLSKARCLSHERRRRRNGTKHSTDASAEHTHLRTGARVWLPRAHTRIKVPRERTRRNRIRDAARGGKRPLRRPRRGPQPTAPGPPANDSDGRRRPKAPVRVGRQPPCPRIRQPGSVWAAGGAAERGAPAD